MKETYDIRMTGHSFCVLATWPALSTAAARVVLRGLVGNVHFRAVDVRYMTHVHMLTAYDEQEFPL